MHATGFMQRIVIPDVAHFSLVNSLATTGLAWLLLLCPCHSTVHGLLIC